MIEQLFDYGLRVLPGIFLIAATYLLLPSRTVAFRLFLLVFGFILIRDVMTPLGFWRFGITNHAVWIRFIDNGVLLLILGVVSLVTTFIVIYLNPSLKAYLVWSGKSKILSIIVGLVGAAIVVAPFLMIYSNIPIEQRGGVVSEKLLIQLLIMTLLGNFMEEVLFRGYVQGYLENYTGAWRAAFLSGLLFSAGHIFLSATVTDLGFIILLFTLYEGIICGIVRMKNGIVASTLTHGITIFVLASGWI